MVTSTRSKLFVARYKGSTLKHCGIEHIEGDTKEEVLTAAQKVTEQHGLQLQMISYYDHGTPQQVWNGERAERIGDGWLYDRFGYREAFGED